MKVLISSVLLFSLGCCLPSPSSLRSTTYTNPVFWEDLADIDIFRVDDTYYYSASTMHYSPGAPILRSYDLLNWEFAGHSVPVLDFGEKYNLVNGQAYAKGVWASFLKYRESNGLFYWGGCIEFNQTYIYTSSSVDGPWESHPSINNCYYDAGMLIDDDDTMYVSYGNTEIHVAQLSADGLSEVTNAVVYSADLYIEGSRFYKVNGTYYILVTHPANAEYVLKSTGNVWGPYEMQPLLNAIAGPIPGGDTPHQGGIVDTQNGDWYYMAFADVYPGGRIPVLAPITWGDDGWPVLTLVDGAWGATYTTPNIPATTNTIASPVGIDNFPGTVLGPQWEWNHNPDNTKWSLADPGLVLGTATVTTDLYAARNTLTHRILGPKSTATIIVDYRNMSDGDRAGMTLLRDVSAWIGVVRDSGVYSVVMANNLTMDSDWNTVSTGQEQARSGDLGDSRKIWFRTTADIAPGADSQGLFEYSIDGETFLQLGPTFVMNSNWTFFMGYRYGIFNYATIGLGGSVVIESFDMELS